MPTSRVLLPSLVAALAALPALPAQAADRHVDPSGNDASATCAADAPCSTIQRAVDVAANGEKVHLGPGTYAEDIDTSKRLEFIGAGAERTTVAAPGRYPAFDLDNGGAVRSLTATRAPGVGQAATVKFLNANAVAPRQYALTDVAIVSGRETTDGGGAPALEAGTVGTALMVLAVERTSLTQADDAFTDQPTTRITNNVTATIRDVTITPDAHGGSQPGVIPGAALDVYGAATATFERVRSAGTSGGGIVARRGANLTIRSSHFASDAEALRIDSELDPVTVRAYDSAFVAFGDRQNRRALVVDAEGGHDVELDLVRSTVAVSAPTPAAALDVGARDSTDADVQLVDTVVRSHDTGLPTGVPDVYAANAYGGDVQIETTRAAYGTAQAAGGASIGAATVTADPRFADIGARDVRLTAGSPLVDAGDPYLASVSDPAGTARPQDGDGDGTARGDIGAYELAAAAPPAPPAAQPTPPAPSPSAVPGPSAAPAALVPAPPVQAAPSTRDAVAPRVTGLKAASGRARFTLAEPATVSLTVDRRRGKRWTRVQRTATRTAKAGAVSLALPRLPRGSYRVTLVAVDAAGNRTTKAVALTRR